MSLMDLEWRVKACYMCNLCFSRNNTVFSRGRINSNIMIVGMCPGAEEDAKGKPFVGRSGQLLDKTLVDIDAPDVYITNLLKCYVKPGRKLDQEWVDKCKGYLFKQITIIKPKIIVTLGADASYALINPSRKYMKDIRGKMWRSSGNLKVIPTYHPSWVLRRGGYGTDSWKIMRDDMCKAVNEYGR